MNNVQVEKKIGSSGTPGNIHNECEVIEEDLVKRSREREIC